MESWRWVGDFSVGGGKGREVAVDGFALWRQFMQFLGLEIHIVGTETELLAPLYVSSAGKYGLELLSTDGRCCPLINGPKPMFLWISKHVILLTYIN